MNPNVFFNCLINIFLLYPIIIYLVFIFKLLILKYNVVDGGDGLAEDQIKF